MSWFVYILKCSDESYYVGQTNDLEKRIKSHNSGRASQYTSSRLPVTLVYSESLLKKDEAVKREAQLKKWSRAKKQALIDGDLNLLKKLSKPHSDRAFASKHL